jgi:hypothetical protein
LRLQSENRQVPANDPDRLKTVITLWLSDQANFYQKAHKNNDRDHDFWNRISKIFLVSTLFAAGLLVWPFSAVRPPDEVISYLVVLSALLLSAGMTLAYAEQRLFAMHARHFGAMRDLFRSAENQSIRLLDEGRAEVVASILQQMGEEALAENTDWLILHRVRHFEVPNG